LTHFVNVCLLTRQAPAFTYRTEVPLTPGTLVRVPFRNGESWGITWDEVPPPEFITKEIIEAPLDFPLIPTGQMELARWICEYYVCPAGAVVRHLLPGDGGTVLRMLGIGRKSTVRKRAQADPPAFGHFELNPRQRECTASLQESIAKGSFQPFLLRGVTGSGKTAVFLEAARTALEAGKSILYLVPEIGLTPQTGDRICQILGEHPAMFHSGLSLGERASAWLAVRKGQRRIAMGARSALFAPLENIGLIIVDEEHDNSYKQDEAPRFHARDAAVWFARKSSCTIVMASATPSLESWKNAKEERYALLELPERAQGQPLPEITIVDRRKDPAPGSLTIPAREALQETIARGERAILLLNRRGWAPSMECRSCGHVPECPECPGMRMVLHRREARLICHHCGWTEIVPKACPKCGSESLDADGIAIQRLEEEVLRLLPGTIVTRMDRDVTAGKRDELRTRLDTFRDQGGVLIGTQMVSKGHDFPAVTLVIAADGDVGVGVADFRAGERTFQTLSQTSGRCGRDNLPGKVFLQTRDPASPLLARVQTHDFLGFAEQELEMRKELRLPPWKRMVLVEMAGASALETEKALGQVPRRLGHLENIQILGPIPAPIAVVRNAHRYHLLIKHEASSSANLKAELRKWLMEPRSPLLKAHVDIDPVDLL
jgi:primosomal protein N' (replication factor Y) (superfamily II helicase)